MDHCHCDSGFIGKQCLFAGSRTASSGCERDKKRLRSKPKYNEVLKVKSAFIFGLVASLALSALCPAQSSGPVVNVSYDKFEDLTEVSTSESKVDEAIARNKAKQDLRLRARYMCAGNTSHCRPDRLGLLFLSYSNFEHIRSIDLVLLFDGKRVRASKPNWSSGDDGAGHPIEHITFSIPVEDFLKLALAEKVEGKLGETTFKLSEDNLTAMRALANEIEPVRGKGAKSQLKSSQRITG